LPLSSQYLLLLKLALCAFQLNHLKEKQNKAVYLQGVLRLPGHLGDTFETEAAMLVI